jgi:hypothetical protein
MHPAKDEWKPKRLSRGGGSTENGISEIASACINNAVTVTVTRLPVAERESSPHNHRPGAWLPCRSA